jgi:hypothetical protein
MKDLGACKNDFRTSQALTGADRTSAWVFENTDAASDLDFVGGFVAPAAVFMALTR